MGECLGFDRIDYLVLSGDITNRGNPDRYNLAAELVQRLVQHFSIDSRHCVFVPGNHNTNIESPPSKRFKAFSGKFYELVQPEPYPQDDYKQGIAGLDEADGVQFLALNSAWNTLTMLPASTRGL